MVSSSCPEVLRAIRFAAFYCSSFLVLMMVKLWVFSCRFCGSVFFGALISPSCSGVFGAIRFVTFCCYSSLALMMVRPRASFCRFCRSVSSAFPAREGLVVS